MVRVGESAHQIGRSSKSLDSTPTTLAKPLYATPLPRVMGSLPSELLKIVLSLVLFDRGNHKDPREGKDAVG